MSRTRFNIAAFAYGIVWYVLLSLPMSPASAFILAGGRACPNWTLVTLMCVASIVSAQFYWLDLKFAPDEEKRHPIRTASALALITACIFGALAFMLTLVFMGQRGFLSTSPFIVVELIGGILLGMFYGGLFGLLSAHVAVPAAMLEMAILQRAARGVSS